MNSDSGGPPTTPASTSAAGYTPVSATAIRLALCQLNTAVGDIAGNTRKILASLDHAARHGCAMAVFPELSISGYPPEDLLLKQRFIAECAAALDQIAEATQTHDCAAIVGFPAAIPPDQQPQQAHAHGAPRLHNAAAVCAGGQIRQVVHKSHLPNYAVFDEHRYFAPGRPHPPVSIHNARVGISICEDLWVERGAIEDIARGGAELVLNLNASPYHLGKWDSRELLLERRCQEYGVPFVYVNQVGGQDELVFDGMSAVFDETGRLAARCPQFLEEVLVVDVELPSRRRHLEQMWQEEQLRAAGAGSGSGAGDGKKGGKGKEKDKEKGKTDRTFGRATMELLGLAPDRSRELAREQERQRHLANISGAPESSSISESSSADTNPAHAASPANLSPAHLIAPRLEIEAEVYEALKLGVRDYIAKNHFSHVCVGLSGGIDSSLVAAIATDALGPDHVHGVLLPSRYSSDHSLADAEQLCRNLGIDHSVVPIEPAHTALLEMLQPHLAPDSHSLTEQNLQSRIRGTVLMAFANSRGWLNLTTSNKSEVAVGYSTLYGDTAGAFAVIKDVWKQQVYALARWRNRRGDGDPDSGPVIPESVLTKAPSAELRPDQTDEQSLPPYDTLDQFLYALVEEDMTAAELMASPIDWDTSVSIARMVDQAEYKRRQQPPGIRITKKAFGKDRRMPISNAYTGLPSSDEPSWLMDGETDWRGAAGAGADG